MKIAFVLGAGASCAFGYPAGTELRRQILDQLRQHNGKLKAALLEAGNEPDEIEQFREDFYYSGYDTIDAFLSGQSSNSAVLKIGKQVIVKMITSYENIDSLFQRTPRHWYFELVRFLRENRNYANRDMIGFYTFNYDLSLDHYLYRSLKAGGGFPDSALLDFLRGNIVHIHGSVGSLAWQNGSGSVRNYAASVSSEELQRLANDIVTTHESVELEEKDSKRLLTADTVVFLGFRFAESNLTKLSFASLASSGSITMIASTYKDPELKEKLSKVGRVSVRDTDAYGVVEELLGKLRD